MIPAATTTDSGSAALRDRRLPDALAYARRSDFRDRQLNLLRRLVSMPTHAGSPSAECAAALLANELRRIGFHRCAVLRAWPSAPPSVWAELRDLPGKPCLLLYGHFDVQPPGAMPWRRGPYSAAVASGRVHGRGASDNKGPLISMLAGLESYLATAGRLPANVRVWLEGEEEQGSPHLREFLDRHGELLRADAVALSDSTRLPGDPRPILTSGLRGMLDVVLTTGGPEHALHSGTFGGEVTDPVMLLTRMVASLSDVDGRIAVRGFYDSVRRPSAPELCRHAAVGARRRALEKVAGVGPGGLRGERGWAPGQRSALRPSVTVVGLSAGRTDASAAAAIASSASARINIRLVADQQPAAIARRLSEHWNRMVPCGARAGMRVIAQAYPVTVDLAHPAVAALERVLEIVWQQPVLAVRNGGTVPIVAELHRRYGMTALMWALSGADDRIHAADESFALADLWRGTEVVVRLLAEVAH